MITSVVKSFLFLFFLLFIFFNIIASAPSPSPSRLLVEGRDFSVCPTFPIIPESGGQEEMVFDSDISDCIIKITGGAIGAENRVKSILFSKSLTNVKLTISDIECSDETSTTNCILFMRKVENSELKFIRITRKLASTNSDGTFTIFKFVDIVSNSPLVLFEGCVLSGSVVASSGSVGFLMIMSTQAFIGTGWPGSVFNVTNNKVSVTGTATGSTGYANVNLFFTIAIISRFETLTFTENSVVDSSLTASSNVASVNVFDFRNTIVGMITPGSSITFKNNYLSNCSILSNGGGNPTSLVFATFHEIGNFSRFVVDGLYAKNLSAKCKVGTNCFATANLLVFKKQVTLGQRFGQTSSAPGTLFQISNCFIDGGNFENAALSFTAGVSSGVRLALFQEPLFAAYPILPTPRLVFSNCSILNVQLNHSRTFGSEYGLHLFYFERSTAAISGIREITARNCSLRDSTLPQSSRSVQLRLAILDVESVGDNIDFFSLDGCSISNLTVKVSKEIRAALLLFRNQFQTSITGAPAFTISNCLLSHIDVLASGIVSVTALLPLSIFRPSRYLRILRTAISDIQLISSSSSISSFAQVSFLHVEKNLIAEDPPVNILIQDCAVNNVIAVSLSDLRVTGVHLELSSQNLQTVAIDGLVVRGLRLTPSTTSVARFCGFLTEAGISGWEDPLTAKDVAAISLRRISLLSSDFGSGKPSGTTFSGARIMDLYSAPSPTGPASGVFVSDCIIDGSVTHTGSGNHLRIYLVRCGGSTALTSLATISVRNVTLLGSYRSGSIIEIQILRLDYGADQVGSILVSDCHLRLDEAKAALNLQIVIFVSRSDIEGDEGANSIFNASHNSISAPSSSLEPFSCSRLMTIGIVKNSLGTMQGFEHFILQHNQIYNIVNASTDSAASGQLSISIFSGTFSLYNSGSSSLHFSHNSISNITSPNGGSLSVAGLLTDSSAMRDISHIYFLDNKMTDLKFTFLLVCRIRLWDQKVSLETNLKSVLIQNNQFSSILATSTTKSVLFFILYPGTDNPRGDSLVFKPSSSFIFESNSVWNISLLALGKSADDYQSITTLRGIYLPTVETPLLSIRGNSIVVNTMFSYSGAGGVNVDLMQIYSVLVADGDFSVESNRIHCANCSSDLSEAKYDSSFAEISVTLANVVDKLECLTLSISDNELAVTCLSARRITINLVYLYLATVSQSFTVKNNRFVSSTINATTGIEVVLFASDDTVEISNLVSLSGNYLAGNNLFLSRGEEHIEFFSTGSFQVAVCNFYTLELVTEGATSGGGGGGAGGSGAGGRKGPQLLLQNNSITRSTFISQGTTLFARILSFVDPNSGGSVEIQSGATFLASDNSLSHLELYSNDTTEVAIVYSDEDITFDSTSGAAAESLMSFDSNSIRDITAESDFGAVYVPMFDFFFRVCGSVSVQVKNSEIADCVLSSRKFSGVSLSVLALSSLDLEGDQGIFLTKTNVRNVSVEASNGEAAVRLFSISPDYSLDSSAAASLAEFTLTDVKVANDVSVVSTSKEANLIVALIDFNIANMKKILLEDISVAAKRVSGATEANLTAVAFHSPSFVRDVASFTIENIDLTATASASLSASSSSTLRSFVYFSNSTRVSNVNFSLLDNNFSNAVPIVTFDKTAGMDRKPSKSVNFYLKDNSFADKVPNLGRIVSSLSTASNASADFSAAIKWKLDCNRWTRSYETPFLRGELTDGVIPDVEALCISFTATRSRSLSANTPSRSPTRTRSRNSLSLSDSNDTSPTMSANETRSRSQTVHPTSRSAEGSQSETLTLTLSRTVSTSRSPPYNPVIGLDPEVLAALGSTTQTVAGLATLAGSAPTAALAMSRSLGVVDLIGCPRYTPQGTRWINEPLRWSWTLTPGFNLGSEPGAHYRAALVFFLVLLPLAAALAFVAPAPFLPIPFRRPRTSSAPSSSSSSPSSSSSSPSSNRRSNRNSSSSSARNEIDDSPLLSPAERQQARYEASLAEEARLREEQLEEQRKEQEELKKLKLLRPRAPRGSMAPHFILFLFSPILGSWASAVGALVTTGKKVDVLLAVIPLAALLFGGVILIRRLSRAIEEENLDASTVRTRTSKLSSSSSSSTPSSSSSRSGMAIFPYHVVPSFVSRVDPTVAAKKPQILAERVLKSDIGRFLFVGDHTWTRDKLAADDPKLSVLVTMPKFFIKQIGPVKTVTALGDGETDSSRRHRWAPFYVFVNVFGALLLGFFHGFSKGNDNEENACRGAIALSAFVNVVLCILTLYLRPFIIPLYNVCLSVIDITTAIVSVWALILSEEAITPGADSEKVAALQLIALLGATIPSLLILFVKGGRICLVKIAKVEVISAHDHYEKVLGVNSEATSIGFSPTSLRSAISVSGAAGDEELGDEMSLLTPTAAARATVRRRVVKKKRNDQQRSAAPSPSPSPTAASASSSLGRAVVGRESEEYEQEQEGEEHQNHREEKREEEGEHNNNNNNTREKKQTKEVRKKGNN